MSSRLAATADYTRSREILQTIYKNNGVERLIIGRAKLEEETTCRNFVRCGTVVVHGNHEFTTIALVNETHAVGKTERSATASRRTGENKKGTEATSRISDGGIDCSRQLMC